MTTPTAKDIHDALEHARWLRNLNQPLTGTSRMLADVGYYHDQQQAMFDRLFAAKQHSDQMLSAAISLLAKAGVCPDSKELIEECDRLTASKSIALKDSNRQIEHKSSENSLTNS